VQQQHVQPISQALAPTLGQYWRSDTRLAPGRKKPKWAGRAALWLGMLAAVLFFGGLLVTGSLGLLAAFATPVSVVAFFFALIAIIAGIGRVAGFFGAVFALAGNIWFWSWLEAAFG
jgi:ABC-type multidrug transport system fused ATPase/permease subunit